MHAHDRRDALRLALWWACFWSAGYLHSFPAWWAWMGAGAFALTCLWAALAFLLVPDEGPG